MSLRSLCLTFCFSASTTLIWSAELPQDLQLVKQQVIAITSANTNNTENISEVRQQLEPLIAQLEAWFIAHRPDNEVALTQVPWQNLWYDDPDISFDINLGVLRLYQPRDRIFQVIEDGYYYNVSEFRIRVFRSEMVITNYLKGAYDIIRPATLENAGQPRLNTVALEFVANSVRSGPIPQNVNLSRLVRAVDQGLYPTMTVPGPLGVTGELWNRYVDEDLRIAAGFDNSEPETLDLYILRKAETAKLP